MTFKNINDSQLCNSIKDDDQQAFVVFQERYKDIVLKSIYTHIRKGGFHRQLSVHYTSAIEELYSESWLEIYNQLKKNFQFNTTGQLKFYLYRIARTETYKFMKDRISIRKQEGTDSNLQFSRLDYEYEKNSNLFVSVEYNDENNHLIENVLPKLVNNLSEKEFKVLKMHLNGTPQKDIAIELDVDVRTVFNIRKKIFDKAMRLKESLKIKE